MGIFSFILSEEKLHFTFKRFIFIISNMIIYLGINFINIKYSDNNIILYSSFSVFSLLCLSLSFLSIRKVDETNKIKERENYNFDKDDIKFNSTWKVLTF